MGFKQEMYGRERLRERFTGDVMESRAYAPRCAGIGDPPPHRARADDGHGTYRSLRFGHDIPRLL